MAENDTRLETLEDEVKVLKGEVKRTLVDLRALLMREDSPLAEGGFARRAPAPEPPAPKKEVTEVVSEVVAPAPVVPPELLGPGQPLRQWRLRRDLARVLPQERRRLRRDLGPALPQGLRLLHPHQSPARGRVPLPLPSWLRRLLRLSLRRPRPTRLPVPDRGRGQALFPPAQQSKPLRAPDQTWPGWPSKSGGCRIRNGV